MLAVALEFLKSKLGGWAACAIVAAGAAIALTVYHYKVVALEAENKQQAREILQWAADMEVEKTARVGWQTQAQKLTVDKAKADDQAKALADELTKRQAKADETTITIQKENDRVASPNDRVPSVALANVYRSLWGSVAAAAKNRNDPATASGDEARAPPGAQSAVSAVIGRRAAAAVR